MASSSGNSTTTSQLRNSGSEHDLEKMNERKRKRMQSNRESARRSRMRKEKHLNDLTSRVDQLRRENQELLRAINSTINKYGDVEGENSVLRAQMSELSQRLESLNDMVNYINALGGVANGNNNSFDGVDHLGFHASGMNMMGDFGSINGYNVDPWTIHGYFNQQCFVGDVLQC